MTTYVTYDDIYRAQRAITGRVHRTPIISSSYLSTRIGARVYLKLESFQKTGSFKVRGVLNKLENLSAEQKAKGVITFSSGNTAQALAYAASVAKIPAVVVMMTGGDPGKLEATRNYGAEVVLADPGVIRETTKRIQEERGLAYVSPFDDLHVIAGGGTVGLEIMEDVPKADMVLVGIGGGGIISGVAVAAKSTRPKARVIGVEPEGADAMSRSLKAGKVVTLDRVNTIADGLAAPFAGEHTLAHVQKFVDKVVTVSDADIAEAMLLVLERCKVVAEPAAAAPVAALLTGKIKPEKDSNVVCLISGGNVSAAKLKTLIP
ncbi:MAG: pyridoxal-phosphate dependent enzyme [SAR202 cluster bacterium]|nr:pyridoxal-phosphate dependent enzyme [SAR202 cluster bacterium]